MRRTARRGRLSGLENADPWPPHQAGNKSENRAPVGARTEKTARQGGRQAHHNRISGRRPKLHRSDTLRGRRALSRQAQRSDNERSPRTSLATSCPVVCCAVETKQRRFRRNWEARGVRLANLEPCLRFGAGVFCEDCFTEMASSFGKDPVNYLRCVVAFLEVRRNF